MPYIACPARRKDLDAGGRAFVVGELNYQVSRRFLNGAKEMTPYLETDVLFYIKQYADGGAVTYKLINDVVGVMACVSLELGRRELITEELQMKIAEILSVFYGIVAVPYEEEKKILNGDII